ncbi:hypothetical protein Dsin_024153 [Dipteronia sinensis]|uniref:RNase H type-1 domain-containing protein n=1 Tax=Dipteronia sinensis TaxID=43782 RepID=A0AAE0E1F9_9ROSI|nr:hypothetical protein Dsin_024153 [Dipteronia sinensis]
MEIDGDRDGLVMGLRRIWVSVCEMVVENGFVGGHSTFDIRFSDRMNLQLRFDEALDPPKRPALLSSSTLERLQSPTMATVAEALAIFKGILFAKNSRIMPLFIESDAQVVVNLINSSFDPHSDIGLLIKDIRSCKVNFVPRLANGLAKYGLSIENDLFWMEDFPPIVGHAVLEDYPKQ